MSRPCALPCLGWGASDVSYRPTLLPTANGDCPHLSVGAASEVPHSVACLAVGGTLPHRESLCFVRRAPGLPCARAALGYAVR